MGASASALPPSFCLAPLATNRPQMPVSSCARPAAGRKPLPTPSSENSSVPYLARCAFALRLFRNLLRRSGGGSGRLRWFARFEALFQGFHDVDHGSDVRL